MSEALVPELVASRDDDASAFDGCSNRFRLAALIGGARVSGLTQGIGIGLLVGALGGFALYVTRAKKKGTL